MIEKHNLIQALEKLGWHKIKTGNNADLDPWVNPQETEIVHLPTKEAAPDYQRCLNIAASVLRQAEREPLAAWVDRINTQRYEYAVQKDTGGSTEAVYFLRKTPTATITTRIPAHARWFETRAGAEKHAQAAGFPTKIVRRLVGAAQKSER